MITLLAHAKLNLFLRVLSLRSDGLHEIDSLIQTIDLSDTISVAVISNGVVVENDLGVPAEEDLTARAAHLVLMYKHAQGGVKINVEKHIPVGAGLGGGSSDAAAVLWAVDRLFPPPLPKEHLLCLAARLGSDVPLFLTGGRMRVTGRGERLTPLPGLCREYFLLLVPPIHCATAAVYAHFDRVGLYNGQSQGMFALGRNDLEKAALDLYPSLVPYREVNASLPSLYSGMSGSGSAFFSAFTDLDTAEASRQRLAAAFPEARVYLSRATQTGYRLKGRC